MSIYNVWNNNLLTLFTITILSTGLGQQRVMPTGIHSQEKACKQEERLLAKLNTIELDSTLLEVLQTETRLLLDGTHYTLHIKHYTHYFFLA